MSAPPLAAQIKELAAKYPDPRSAVMPALRLAQEHHGWLPAEAFAEVADALDLTPAYCKSIASFYDMYHLAPVGQHLIEVCTNICCGLRGAQQVLDAFKAELGIQAGATTDDGQVTLRAVECLGACAWPAVVAVDHVYRLGVQPDDTAEIAQEVRNG